jgi:hypothetical protein
MRACIDLLALRPERIEMESPDTKYLTTVQLRQRWGNCSEMFLHRKKDDPGFPVPVWIGNHQKFWPLDQIEAYERQCAAKPAPDRRVRKAARS